MASQLQLINAPARPRIAIGMALVHVLAERAETLTGMDPGTLCQPCRSREVSWVRFAVMKAARERGRRTTVIGRAFGMDHTSVIHGIRRADELEAENEEFAELMMLLRRPT